jgi:hypothetical protein
MAVSGHDRLRALLGESIPAGGSESDTLFSDDQVDDLLTRHTSVEASLAEGWQQKAASLATLVDRAEGDSKESLSQLHKQALTMVDLHQKDPDTGLPWGQVPITRVRKLKREGFYGP